MKRRRSKWHAIIWGRVPTPSGQRKSWDKVDWAEWAIMFFFLIGVVVALSLVGALIMSILEKLAIL